MHKVLAIIFILLSTAMAKIFTEDVMYSNLALYLFCEVSHISPVLHSILLLIYITFYTLPKQAVVLSTISGVVAMSIASMIIRYGSTIHTKGYIARSNINFNISSYFLIILCYGVVFCAFNLIPYFLLSKFDMLFINKYASYICIPSFNIPIAMIVKNIVFNSIIYALSMQIYLGRSISFGSK